MKEHRKEILPGVWMTCLQTDKFKTGLLSLHLLTQLDREHAPMNALIPSVLCRGCARYPDMDAVNRRLDELYGARLEPSVRKKGEIQAIGFWADFVDERYLPAGESLLTEVTDLLGQILLDPCTRGGLLRRDYVDSEKEKLLQSIRGRVNDKISYSLLRLIETMCAAENFAVPAAGFEDEAQSINYTALTKHYRQLLTESPIEVFYCGSAEPAAAEAAVTAALTLLPRGEINYDIGTDIRMNTLEEEPRIVTEEMAVTQGKLAIGFRLGDYMENPDQAALMVMNAVFGGCTASKLFMNVREKLSLCYFASSSCSFIKGILYVVSGIEVRNYDTALAEIFVQLKALQAGDISDEEFAAAKASVVSDLLAVSDSVGALEGFRFTQNLLGLEYGPDELAVFAEEVTKEDIIEAAAGLVCDEIYFLKGTGEEDSDAED